MATFAKVDAAAMEKEQLIVCGSFLTERGITAVAGNVETYNQLRTCKTAGFEYFHAFEAVVEVGRYRSAFLDRLQEIDDAMVEFMFKPDAVRLDNSFQIIWICNL